MYNKPDIMKICSEFLSLPIEKVPSNEDLVKETLIAESIRLAFRRNYLDVNRNSEVHVLSLRNWVIRKLRGIIPEIQSNTEGFFEAVLRKGPGPNLEFLGDIVKLSGGYYLQAPTRVVQIENTSWILISGLPTQVFAKEGLNVDILGVGRWIRDASKSDLERLEIPIQTMESYAELQYQELNGTQETFLDYVLEHKIPKEWVPGPDWEAYTGTKKSSCYGFDDCWGLQALEVPHSTGVISLWREPREWGGFEYWLRVGHRRIQPLIHKGKDRNGRPGWVVDEFDYTAIHILQRFYKHICLWLDMTSGKPRMVRFEPLNDRYLISMNFSPPASILRWLHATGARWNGYSSSYIQWIIPQETVMGTTNVLKTLEVKIEQK
jgi:hypothetical protein